MCNAYTHTQPFNGPLSGSTQVSRYQKGKTNLDLLKQETVSGSGISWAICNSLQTDNYASTPSHSFLQAGCPYCRPTNSVVKMLRRPFIFWLYSCKIWLLTLILDSPICTWWLVELFITKTENQPITKGSLINGRRFEQYRNIWRSIEIFE